MIRNLKPGDPVIYRALKTSAHPGPRAEMIDATPKGEHYTYEVDKYWVVAERRDAGEVLLRTRRGKEHVLTADDPRLRRPNLWERLWLRGRFPSLGEIEQNHGASA